MKVSRAQTLILLGIALASNACTAFGQQPKDDAGKVTLAVVRPKHATTTQRYTCRISSHRHIEVRAPEDGYLEEIVVKEGQAVKKGDLMFRFTPTIHKARLDAELAEVQIAELELNNAKKLIEQKAVSQETIQLQTAKLAKAKAKADLARAELDFAIVRAPFDGLIDRFTCEQGCLVLKGETLTNLYDNSVMRAYFNVPEATYLQYVAGRGENRESPEVKLTLADQTKFPHAGKIAAIEAAFNSENGTIAFRADFPNPEGLLRHGQAGTVLIDRELKDAILIPQRATFEDRNVRYVFVVDKDQVAHRREVAVETETGDQLVVKKGVEAGDTIVVDGVRQVRDGEKVEAARDGEKAK
jgi:membrane fusion protein (multidrug efflux system)